MKFSKDINSKEDIINAFKDLTQIAKDLGHPILLDTESSNSLSLYINKEFPDRILVDKFESSKRRRCPRCGRIVIPTQIFGYSYYCRECDEDFYKFETNEDM